jgi:cytochrome c-type biogenesis protein CcmE
VRSKKRNRLFGIIAMLSVCSLGVYIILSNLNDNIVFFYPPSELSKIKSNTEKVRVGGFIKEGSIELSSDGKVIFIITDYIAELQIEYHDILPALFREKQGVVAEGLLLSKNLFKASKLLAKHDENYRPPELRHIKPID